MKASADGYLVLGDADGDKQADFAVLVENVPTLKAGDFIL